jgi:integrase
LKVAKKEADQDTYDIVVVAACTGMRRADCCYLTWDVVDLAHATIETKARKTKKSLFIPILPLLGEVLSRRHAARTDGKKHGRGAFVIPAMAELIVRNPDAITDRMRKILLAAGFDAEQLRAPKSKGCHRAVCLRGFASLRATFTTLALNAGVPIELVRKVTGHTTDAIVRTRYHNPSREDLITQFRERMPAPFGTKGTAEEKISHDLRIWLCSQLDRLDTKGVSTTVAEIKARLGRAMAV